VCDRTAGYLRGCLTQQTSVVDFFSFLYSCLLVQAYGGPDILAGSAVDWPERVAAELETFHTGDGGYAKAPGSASGSTYHTFLVGLCYQMLGRSLPRPAEVATFVGSRRREDGGFVEIAPMKRAGTNPTAAAIGILQLLDASSDGTPYLTYDVRTGVAAFLAALPSSEGGLRANGRIPVADLLSTFTGLWTLHQLGGLERIDRVAALRYAESLQASDGGFRGNSWDSCTDVEYTFYGLGVLGLLS
jgi:geranylgeranyl transferase type-2 subunit beta